MRIGKKQPDIEGLSFRVSNINGTVSHHALFAADAAKEGGHAMAGVYGGLTRVCTEERLGDCLKSGRRLCVQAVLGVTGLIVVVAAAAGALPALFMAAGLAAIVAPVVWRLVWARSSAALAQTDWMTTVDSWAGLAPVLVGLPDDWNILEYLGLPVLVGPGGVVVLQIAKSDNGSRETLGSVLEWADLIGNKAGLTVRPVTLTAGGCTSLASDRCESVVGLGSRLSQMNPVLVGTDVKKWVSVALGLSSGQSVSSPYPQASFEAVVMRRKPSRRKNGFLHVLLRTGLIAAALVATAAVAFTIWKQPLLRVGLATRSFLSEVVSPKAAARLGLPVTETLSEGIIRGTVKFGIAPRTSSGGAATSGWLREGSELIILDQVADMKNVTWFYVRSGSAEGWTPLKAVRVMGLPKGTVLYPEADERIDAGGTLVRGTAAAALSHRSVPGREGTGWWEVILPAGRRGWVKSDNDPLAFLEEGNK